MPFTTKLDFSDNRQVKQRIETIQVLSGATSFGVPFNTLPTGPDLTTSGITESYFNVISTFSGNTGTTNYTWYDNRMQLGYTSLSAITPLNSGTTQHTGNVYTANTITTIDGNQVTLTYSGVSFDISNISIISLGGGNYSGTVYSNTFNIISANTLDFTGRTIWVDVSGITRTQDLIITNSPNIGYVWTCIDSEGKGAWSPTSGGTSGSTGYWSASTGSNAIVVINSGCIASGLLSIAEGYQTSAGGDWARAEGFQTLASGNISHAEGYQTTAGENGHAEGDRTTAYGGRSHAEGGFTTTTADGAHAEGIGNLASGTASHVEGSGNIASGNYSHAEGQQTTASGESSHAEGKQAFAIGQYSHAEGNLTRAIGIASHAEGSGNLSGYTQAIGDYSHAGGYQSIASGITSFVHGSGSTAYGNGTIVLGNNLSGTTDNYTYVNSLNIKNVGSSAFVNDLRIDGSGNLTTNTSDVRFKENINNITNALEKIKQLRGVTYQWKDKISGGNGIKLGFIAQEVEDVVSDLVFTNKVDGYKGIHIDGIIPLLVESIKELISDDKKIINTQTLLAEDNFIELNYSGNTESALGGGIRVLHAIENDLGAEIITDKDGNWVTNNDFKSKSLTIPTYTPTSTKDEFGTLGNITSDDNYIYIKTTDGWKRSSLESF